jgi:alkylation response protein AidB-like acyl-CoA dehydrogenase
LRYTTLNALYIAEQCIGTAGPFRKVPATGFVRRLPAVHGVVTLMSLDEALPNYDESPNIRVELRKLCANLPGSYWQKLDRERAYPTEFVRAFSDGGWLAALIPEKFGGADLSLSAAAAILEEIQRGSRNGAACYAQMYIMSIL